MNLRRTSSKNFKVTINPKSARSNEDPTKLNENNFEIINNRYKFEKEHEIGRGSYGTVYHGKDLSKNEKVAVKLLDKKQAREKEVSQSIRNEVKIHSRVNHPHIIKVIDYFEDNNYVYLIMEVASRGNLYQYLLTKKTLSEDEAFIYFFQTL